MEIQTKHPQMDYNPISCNVVLRVDDGVYRRSACYSYYCPEEGGETMQLFRKANNNGLPDEAWDWYISEVVLGSLLPQEYKDSLKVEATTKEEFDKACKQLSVDKSSWDYYDMSNDVPWITVKFSHNKHKWGGIFAMWTFFREVQEFPWIVHGAWKLNKNLGIPPDEAWIIASTLQFCTGHSACVGYYYPDNFLKLAKENPLSKRFLSIALHERRTGLSLNRAFSLGGLQPTKEKVTGFMKDKEIRGLLREAYGVEVLKYYNATLLLNFSDKELRA